MSSWIEKNAAFIGASVAVLFSFGIPRISRLFGAYSVMSEFTDSVCELKYQGYEAKAALGIARMEMDDAFESTPASDFDMRILRPLVEYRLKECDVVLE